MIPSIFVAQQNVVSRHIYKPLEKYSFLLNFPVNGYNSNWRISLGQVVNGDLVIIEDNFTPLLEVNNILYVNNFTFPDVQQGIYYFIIYEDGVETKYVSNQFQVIRDENILAKTSYVEYWNSTNIYNYPYQETGVHNKLRLALTLAGRPYRYEITQYREATTGQERNSRAVLDGDIIGTTYRFDINMHDEFSRIMIHDNILITANNVTRKYVTKGSYEYEESPNGNLSNGQFTLIDSNFSETSYSC